MSLYRFVGNRLIVNFHPGQKRAWTSKKKIIAVVAGTGGGKTSFGIIWLIREIAKEGAKALVVAPNFMMLQRILLPQTIEVLDKVYGGTYNAGARIYEIGGGRAVYFGSAVEPFSLEGTHLDAVWLDEAGQMKEEVFRVALRRIAVKQGRLLITTTPYSFNWIRKLAEDEAVEFINFPSIMNPAYPKEEFERAKKLLPRHIFEMFYLGKFAKSEASVFAEFSWDDNTFYELPGKPDRVVAGLDFGYNNPTACVVVYERDGNFFVVDELYKVKLTMDELVMHLKKIEEEHGVEKFYADPSEPGTIEQLKRQGLPVYPAKSDVQAGITLLQTLFKTGRLKIKKSLKNLLYEIENYRYAEKNDALLDKPVKEDDHAVDALRYCLFTHLTKRKTLYATKKPIGF